MFRCLLSMAIAASISTISAVVLAQDGFPTLLLSYQPPSVALVPTPTTTSTSSSIQVNKIEVIVSTVFSSIQIDAITKSVEGRTVTFAQIQEVADKITQLYRDRDYITFKAIVPKQRLDDGIIQIIIIENSIK